MKIVRRFVFHAIILASLLVAPPMLRAENCNLEDPPCPGSAPCGWTCGSTLR